MTEPTDVSQASPDLSASPDAATSSVAEGTVTPQGDSPEGVIAQPSDQAKAEVDPLEGVPTLEELQGKENVPYAKAVAQLRGVYEPLKQQHDELATKYSVFEPVADRFQSADEVEKLVTLNDSLNKYTPDPDTGALRPDPAGFAQQISTDDPERADYLTSALAWGQTKHPATGQPVTRAELILEVMRQDPELRSHALQVLGGVEPSAVPAPAWAPSQEELNRFVADPERLTPEDRALQDTFKKMSYDERLELADRSPEFIRSTLRTLQQNQMLQANEERRVAAERQAEIDAERKVEAEASQAGDSYVEQGFKETLTNVAKSIYETYQPTDDPATNRKEGAQVLLSVVALSHPDTRWAGEILLKEMGVNPQDLEPLNKAREAYAMSGRQYGYLTHKKQPAAGEHPSKAQQRLMVQAQNLATKIIAGRNEYFTKRVESHNNKLDQTERARIPVGSGVAASSSNGRLQPGQRHPWQDL